MHHESLSLNIDIGFRSSLLPSTDPVAVVFGVSAAVVDQQDRITRSVAFLSIEG